MKSFLPRAWCAAAMLLVLGAFSGTALADPPGRVARVGYLSGSVSFQPAGDDGWSEASLNRPLVTGDRLYTDRDSRVELQVGAAAIRLDERSTSTLLNIDDSIVQVELTEGVMNLSVRSLASGQSFEIDTPTLAFVVDQPGVYRIDIDPQGTSTMLTVFSGAGDVYGENNASYSVRSGNSYRFNDSALNDYEVFDLPRQDDFDGWASSRDNRFESSVSRRYVAEDVIGYSDLDEYGSWSSVPEYGNVWYPTRVSAGWAPYRSGHWSWIDPWGWTWVDNNPWGFAPFHYGRWAYVGNRWGWCPGPRHVRAVYAPALVAFVGGSGWGASISLGGGGPVGWFPLGPRDVYVPWYRASRSYFTNVNVHNTTIINNTNITNIYNNYSNGRPIRNDYAYRGNTAAMTAVSREAFVGARPVAASRVRLNATQLRNAQVVSRMGITPTRASITGTTRHRAAPAAATAAMKRSVIARTAPPRARAVSTEARLKAIQRNNAQPLARDDLRKIAAERPAAARNAASQRVQVVGGKNARKPQPLPTRSAAGTRGATAPTRSAPTRGAPANADRANARTPAARAPAAAQRGDDARKQQPATQDRGSVRSTQFAPRGNRSAPTQERGKATPQQARTPAARAPTERASERATQRQPATPQRETRRAPQPRTTPAPQKRATPAPQQREQPRSVRAPQQRAEPQKRSAPAPQQRAEPQRRSAPAPQQRAQPQKRSSPAPQQRAPQQRTEPQKRSAPAPQQRAPQPRSAPQQRAPQPRSAPQQRAQPQPRNAPAPQKRSAPERKGKDKDDERDNGRR